MQNLQVIQELSDQDLAAISGGLRLHGGPDFSSNARTAVQNGASSANVSVDAHAGGGLFHLDTAFAQTKSISIYKDGESVSMAFGFAIGIAI